MRTVGSDGRDTSMSDKRRTISQTEREKTRGVMALCRATADLESPSHHVWLDARPESSAPVRREAVGGRESLSQELSLCDSPPFAISPLILHWPVSPPLCPSVVRASLTLLVAQHSVQPLPPASTTTSTAFGRLCHPLPPLPLPLSFRTKLPRQLRSRALTPAMNSRPHKQSMSELKLRRLTEHNQRLREDLARPRIRVSEASAR